MGLLLSLIIVRREVVEVVNQGSRVSSRLRILEATRKSFDPVNP